MLMRKPGPVKAQSFLKLKPGWDKATGQSGALPFKASVPQLRSRSPLARCWEALCCLHGRILHTEDISPACFEEGTAAPQPLSISSSAGGQRDPHPTWGQVGQRFAGQSWGCQAPLIAPCGIPLPSPAFTTRPGREIPIPSPSPFRPPGPAGDGGAGRAQAAWGSPTRLSTGGPGQGAREVCEQRGDPCGRVTPRPVPQFPHLKPLSV